MSNSTGPVLTGAAHGPHPRTAGFFSRHPVGFWFFFWGEFAERSSYYGMRAILALYMTEELALHATADASIDDVLLHRRLLLPPAGRRATSPTTIFGKYWTIVGFSIPYILGHVILGDREHAVPGRRPVAAGDGQRRDQAEHLDPDGDDLRPAAARPGEAAERRLRHVLLAPSTSGRPSRRSPCR